jgi:hypothetical protein
MMRLFTILTILSCFPLPAAALEQTEPDAEMVETLVKYIDQYVDVPAGALDWKILGTTEETQFPAKDENGIEYTYTKPVFPPAVKELDNTDITIKGFMFPLEESEAQAHFLIGPFPVSCPYHYHVGPALVIEVKMGKGKIKFTEEPIIVKGRLQLVPDDPEFGTFYRLLDAAEAKK